MQIGKPLRTIVVEPLELPVEHEALEGPGLSMASRGCPADRCKLDTGS